MKRIALMTLISCLFLVFFLQLNAKPHVYDCFLFCNELEILKIRLHEMDPYVDKFVLVESTETFRGKPKPLNYANNCELFQKFKDKIIYVVSDQQFSTDNPWDRESFQRNQIMKGLTDCKDSDIILISDVDEIVRKNDIPLIVSALEENGYRFVGVSQRYHSNFLNSLPSTEIWRGTVASTYKELKNSSPQSFRGMKNHIPSVAHGWHFTWVGGIDQILYKLGAYSHAESDTPEIRESKQRDAELSHLCPVVDVDETFPDYVRENQDYLEKIGFILKPRN